MFINKGGEARFRWTLFIDERFLIYLPIFTSNTRDKFVILMIYAGDL